MLPRWIRYWGSAQGRKELKYALARKLFNPILRPFGYTLVADHFYQPIPSDRELLLYKNTPRSLRGLDFRLEDQVRFVKGLFHDFRGEFNDPAIFCRYGYDGRTGFSNGDPHILYAIIRDVRPSRIVEVGAGKTTQIMAAALAMNVAEGSPKTKVISIDPYPKPLLKSLAVNAKDMMDFSLLEQPVQSVDPGIFESLGPRDILFVDSSHVFKQGSDVEFEFLNIYPVLKKGVLLHLHDIFLPYDYPLSWNQRNYKFWNEQYFLEVFLRGNDKFKILSSSSVIAHHDSQVFSDAIAAYDPSRVPGSFWMVAQR